jgi:choline transport protein
MNYVSAVYGIIAAIIALDWLVRGRREFRGQAIRHGEIEALQ